MPWSSPLPPAELAAALRVGALFGPVALLAIVSVGIGFAVLVTGFVREHRVRRSSQPTAAPLPAPTSCYTKVPRPV